MRRWRRVNKARSKGATATPKSASDPKTCQIEVAKGSSARARAVPSSASSIIIRSRPSLSIRPAMNTVTKAVMPIVV